MFMFESPISNNKENRNFAPALRAPGKKIIVLNVFD